MTANVNFRTNSSVPADVSISYERAMTVDDTTYDRDDLAAYTRVTVNRRDLTAADKVEVRITDTLETKLNEAAGSQLVKTDVTQSVELKYQSAGVFGASLGSMLLFGENSAGKTHTYQQVTVTINGEASATPAVIDLNAASPAAPSGQ